MSSSVNPVPAGNPPPVPTTTAAPTPGTASAANAYQTAFNSAYYLSKDPIYDPLFGGRPGSGMPNALPLTQAEAWALVAKLIAAGWIVDEEIDAEGMDPLTTMYMRQLYGQDWEPAGLGQTQSTEVITPGEYSGPRPTGTILVSTNIADFPINPKRLPQPTPAPVPAGNVGESHRPAAQFRKRGDGVGRQLRLVRRRRMERWRHVDRNERNVHRDVDQGVYQPRNDDSVDEDSLKENQNMANYQQLIDALSAASGPVETYINSLPNNNPSPGQSDLLNFLQGPFKDACATARADAAAQ